MLEHKKFSYFVLIFNNQHLNYNYNILFINNSFFNLKIYYMITIIKRKQIGDLGEDIDNDLWHIDNRTYRVVCKK